MSKEKKWYDTLFWERNATIEIEIMASKIKTLETQMDLLTEVVKNLNEAVGTLMGENEKEI